MSNNPPPLPSGNPGTPPPVPENRKAIPGTEGMTIEQVEMEVREGGRFVVYSYAFSILIMTFRRSSSVRFLKRGQDGTGSALGYSLISLLFGWWGLPWGPIYTIASLMRNARGGHDVTAQTMAAVVGQSRATSILSERRRPAPVGMGMILFRTTLIITPVVIFFSLVRAMVNQQKLDNTMREQPGYAAYESANDNLNENITGGNNSNATAIAEDLKTVFSFSMRQSKSADKPSATAPPTSSPTVWCHYDEKNVIVLMKIPELRKLDKKTQQQIAESLWKSTHRLLAERQLGRDGMQVGVGLRGLALYDSEMIGPYHPEGDDPPAHNLERSAGVNKMIPMFVAPESTAAAQ